MTNAHSVVVYRVANGFVVTPAAYSAGDKTFVVTDVTMLAQAICDCIALLQNKDSNQLSFDF